MRVTWTDLEDGLDTGACRLAAFLRDNRDMIPEVRAAWRERVGGVACWDIGGGAAPLVRVTVRR